LSTWVGLNSHRHMMQWGLFLAIPLSATGVLFYD